MGNCLVISEGDKVPDDIIETIDGLSINTLVLILSEDGDIQEIKSRNYFRFVLKPKAYHFMYHVIEDQDVLFDNIFICFSTEEFYQKACYRFPKYKSKKGKVYFRIDENYETKKVFSDLENLGYLKVLRGNLGVLI